MTQRTLQPQPAQVSPPHPSPHRPIRRQLIAVDVSTNEAAVAWALGLGAKLRASTVLGHVLVPPSFSPGGAHAAAAAYAASQAKQVRQSLDRASAHLGVGARVVSAPSLGAGLSRLRVEEDADVVVLSRPTRGPLASAFFQSSAERAARHADGPVVIVPQAVVDVPPATTPTCVLACVALGDRAVLLRAAELAEARALRLEVIRVIDASEDEAEALAELGRELRALGSDGVADRVSVIVGRPAAALIEVAKQRQAWCMVVGARSGADFCLGLGPVAAKLARSAPCALWIER